MIRVRSLLAVFAVVASLLAGAPAPAAAPFCDISLTTSPNCYVAADDGTLIALTVRVPAACRSGIAACPSIFEMGGYENGSAEGLTTTGEVGGPGAPLARDSRQLTEMFDGDYATVHASTRGTGCSGGEFDLFSLRSARDGVQMIEWIARQSWSNGRVGIMGHSYSGITGFMVASQNPAALTAVTVSGLIDDLYRGITYPGGVSNMGFPVLWTLGVRPAYDYLGGIAQGIGRPLWRNAYNPQNKTFTTEQSITCAGNQPTKGRTAINDPVVQGLAGDTDNAWWQARALATFAHRIDVPIHIAGSYQDEQTGPRGTTRLWEMIGGVPKRLMITNGDHGTNQSSHVMKDRRDWIDHWMLGEDNGHGGLGDDKTSVSVLQEFDGGPRSIIDDTRFPLSATQWNDWYFQPGGKLAESAPAAAGSTSYLSGSGRQSWSYQGGYNSGPPFTTADGPDELTFRSEQLGKPLSIAGPVTATLHLATSAPDTELFVQLIDEAPDGTRHYLQRGILKASHRAIDPTLSDCVDAANARVSCHAPGARMYRPHRPHTAPALVTPNAPVEYLVEIFPVGHVFRTGHRIVVKVMAPPRVDSYYIYVPKTPPSVNTVFHEPGRLSRVTLPVIPNAAVHPTPPAACTLDAVRCVRRPNG